MRTQHFVVFDSTRSQPDCARSFVTLTRLVLKNGILEKWEIVQSGSGATFREAVPAQPVVATPSDINLFSKGGVYDARETGKAFRKPADRHVVPLEGGTVVA